ncbi:hypothetical protein V2J09_012140 [Rumex salicifolius]
MCMGAAGGGAANIIRAAVLLLAAHTAAVNSKQSTCSFPAIYNFGDSNSDTGSVSAIYGPIPPPNGVTFFHQPAGRWGDGRLMIDFLGHSNLKLNRSIWIAAEKLGLPYLSGYLDSVGADYRHGSNFAMSGSTIELTIIDGRFISAGFNQISFTNQLGQFEQFKNRTTKLYQEWECLKPNLFFLILSTMQPFQSRDFTNKEQETTGYTTQAQLVAYPSWCQTPPLEALVTPMSTSSVA